MLLLRWHNLHIQPRLVVPNPLRLQDKIPQPLQRRHMDGTLSQTRPRQGLLHPLLPGRSALQAAAVAAFMAAAVAVEDADPVSSKDFLNRFDIVGNSHAMYCFN